MGLPTVVERHCVVCVVSEIVRASQPCQRLQVGDASDRMSIRNYERAACSLFLEIGARDPKRLNEPGRESGVRKPSTSYERMHYQ